MQVMFKKMPRSRSKWDLILNILSQIIQSRRGPIVQQGRRGGGSKTFKEIK